MTALKKTAKKPTKKTSKAKKVTRQNTNRNSIFDNLIFEPKTQTQAQVIQDFQNGKNLVLTGYAGTGKTYVALTAALMALMNGDVRHVHIVRSAVAGRNIGFLPGTEEEKLAVYEKAIRSNINKILRRDDAYDCLKHSNLVSFGSTSFERGVTYDNTVVLVDQLQNLEWQQLDTMMTRISSSSKVIFCGDTRQSDLKGNIITFNRFVRVVQKMTKHFSRHDFSIDDIVRGPVVKSWIIQTENDFVRNPM